MLRCLNELVAKSFAIERGVYYGQAKDGVWYVGVREKLILIGVVKPKKGADK